MLTICRPSGPKCKLANGRTVVNLATYNHYNFINNEALKERAVKTLRTYGVGPCGPPGFYGTQDVHGQLEADIAAHIGSDAAIVYAQSFSTVSSVIPAFAKRGDIIVADKAINYAIRKGIQISRSTIRWYEHNDMEDLERVLSTLVKEQERTRKPLTRRFIVTEGLFENIGDTVNLAKVVEMKYKYKFRIVLDETWSYGILGATGRGVTEQQNVDPTQVDMIIGSLAGSLCGGGGFCAGTTEVVEHQRLSAASYTFSAALPAMLATTASETVRILQEQPEVLATLRDNIKVMWTQLDPRSDWVYCSSSPDNPVLLLMLKEEVVESRHLTIEEEEWLMQDIVDEVRFPFQHSASLCTYPPASAYTYSDALGYTCPDTLPYTSPDTLLYTTRPSLEQLLTCLVSRQRRPRDATEEHASSSGCGPARPWLAALARAQGLCDLRAHQEGDGEGWHCDPPCCHQGLDP